MQRESYLAGCIYHMTHSKNLHAIFKQKALLSQEMLKQKGIIPHSIAYQSVQDKRNRIFIQNFSQQQYRNLHCYVPFYFAARPPMLYVDHIASVQKDIVIFEVLRTILKGQGVLFTDGNATNQRLSALWGERVNIVPATLSNQVCTREYIPGGPYGTSQNQSNFYSHTNYLEKLDWDGINDRRYIEDKYEYTRVRASEVLVPDALALEKVQGIAVSTKEMAQSVNELISQYGLTRFVPFANCKPSLFVSKNR